MERITQRSIAFTVTLMLVLATVALSAPKSARSSRYLTIQGRVLHVNRDARTLLVSDHWSEKLYLVNVPKGGTFQITFGMYANMAKPGLEQARRNDRVRMRCIRAPQHLARLDDGREVVVLTVTH